MVHQPRPDHNGLAEQARYCACSPRTAKLSSSCCLASRNVPDLEHLLRLFFRFNRFFPLSQKERILFGPLNHLCQNIPSLATAPAVVSPTQFIWPPLRYESRRAGSSADVGLVVQGNPHHLHRSLSLFPLQ